MRRRKYFTEQKSTKRGGRGEKEEEEQEEESVLPRGNEKWPTCQCALSHRDKSHAGSETLRLARKIPGGKSRECENARAPNPYPSSPLTVDDGKLEKYQIEFESWRTVIKSFEFLPPYIFLFPRIGKSIPAYIRIIHPASRLKFCIQSDRFVSYGFQEIKDLRREGKFIRATKEQNRRCIFFKKSSH